VGALHELSVLLSVNKNFNLTGQIFAPDLQRFNLELFGQSNEESSNLEDTIRSAQPITYFYRIKMTKTSGAARHSRTVALEANAKAFCKVQSNPFCEQRVLNITLTP